MSIQDLRRTEDRKWDNLLKNSSFNQWNAGAAAAPDNWTWTPGSSSTIARDAVNLYGGLYGVSVSENSGGTSSTLSQTIHTDFGIAYWKSKKCRFSVWVKCSTASAVRLELDDGIATTNSSYHTGGGAWEQLVVEKTISATATKVDCVIRFQNAASTYSAYVDLPVFCELSKNPYITPISEPDNLYLRKDAAGSNQDSKLIELTSDVSGSDKKTQIYRSGTNDGIEIKNDAGTVIHRKYDSGIIDRPLQSYIDVYSSSQSFTNGTITKIQYNSEYYDLQSEFDSATNYRFTATKAGKYLITSVISISSGANFAIQLHIYKNGAGNAHIENHTNTNNANYEINITKILHLNANDYIEMYFGQWSGVSKNVTSTLEILKVI